MMEVRVRSKIPEAELKQKIGKIVTSEDFNLLITRSCRVLKPDGKPLCVYLPKALLSEMHDCYPILKTIRMSTDNRGLASGTKRINAGGNRTRSMPVMSGIMGAMDPAPNRNHCRLTAFTRDHLEKWNGIFPLLERIGDEFKSNVPDRWKKQMEYVDATHPDWIVPGTPFTTITVNNSYSTGVHTDKGDLEAGFSCLAVSRTESYSGGHICFPEYRVAADMQDGDLLLMDAHEFHGNTAMVCACGARMSTGRCPSCSAERISIVCYFREQMPKCDSMDAEWNKRESQASKAIA
jgi:hypothetical protein